MNRTVKMSIASAAVALGVASASVVASAREHINVVGSSTVYPFATVVAERLGKTTDNPTPTVESTGSGGGMKLFCSGIGTSHPDVTNASRRMKKSEFAQCQENGVKDIVEVLIGYDGVVLANSNETDRMELSRRDIFLALAKQVPNPDGFESLIDNPYKTWKDVNPALPDTKIEVLGPPPTSGTRDAFAELALEGGCKSYGFIKRLKDQSKAAKKAGDKKLAKILKNNYRAICHTVREDGAYIEAGENDNLIVQKLEKNPNALGVFGFSFLDQNSDKVQGSIIEGQLPTFESIADKSYPVSRPLYFYVKKAHVGVVPGIQAYIDEFTSEKAWGEEGYLAEKGMIPMGDGLRASVGKNARSLTPMTGEGL